MFRDVIFHFDVPKMSPTDLKPFQYIEKKVVLNYQNIHLFSSSYLSKLTTVIYIGKTLYDPIPFRDFKNLKNFYYVRERQKIIKKRNIFPLVLQLCGLVCSLLIIVISVTGLIVYLVSNRKK